MDADKVGYLKRLPMFCELGEESIAKLASRLESKRFETGQVLFQQGDYGDILYIIKSGRVKIVSDGTQGEELVFNQFGPGDFFGEMALIDGAPRSASAVALTTAEMLLLKRDDFLHVLAEHPLVAVEIIRGISTKLRFATTYIQKAIAWSQRIASGEYTSAMGDIEQERISLKSEGQSDQAQVDSLIAAFFRMAEVVKKREEELKSQLIAFHLEIDEVKARR
jgi:CRP-like cAMP-binding protein